MYSLLVVDDEKDVAKSIAYDINWEELDITEVQCVYNGLEALEYMNKRRVDVVLTDIRMPGMDGIRLAEKIADRWKYVKMIFMTGKTLPPIYVRCIRKRNTGVRKLRDGCLIWQWRN